MPKISLVVNTQKKIRILRGLKYVADKQEIEQKLLGDR